MTATDFIQIIGTAAFAISGYLVGYNKRLDVLGVVITALLTAVGGGMI
ncbi:MAG: TRIC cation channel family protein, partial [Neisseria sp.]|nr:TRIC cation channel family protein [Neisseria sp.]